MNQFICIGGMDGVGKTTLLHNLKKSLPENTAFSIEVPSDDKLIKLVLKEFYHDAIDHYLYQVIFFYSNIERYKGLLKNAEKNNSLYLLSDRTFFEDIIFAEALLNDSDFQVFAKLFNYHLEKIRNEKWLMPSIYLILDGSYQICEQRKTRQLKEIKKWINNKSPFKIKEDFYLKLHSLYYKETSFFWSILKKYSIPTAIIHTDNLSSTETYAKAKEILKFKK